MLREPIVECSVMRTLVAASGRSEAAEIVCFGIITSNVSQSSNNREINPFIAKKLPPAMDVIREIFGNFS